MNNTKGILLITPEPCNIPQNVLEALETLNDFILKNPDIKLSYQ